MVNRPISEFDLYPAMCQWLKEHLKDKYKRQKCDIIVIDCHSVNLDSILIKHGIIDYFPQTVGLKIEIDVLGMAVWENKAKLFFIEAKKTTLNLQNLGQLLIYCKLCNPEEAYLLSSSGLGTLNKVLVNLRREDLLEFGTGKRIKRIKVAKWDFSRCTIDNHSLIPKI